MATHVIIDGYNLLGARGGLSHVSGAALEQARERLLLELATYRQHKGHAVTVVFDGWRQGRGFEGHAFRSGVEVIYSPRGIRADQVIQRLATTYGRECAVVSSDHEVAIHARGCGAIVLAASEFDARLQESRARAQGAGNRRSGQNLAIPAKQMDRRPDSRPSAREKKGNPRRLPKAVRKRLRQLRQF